MRGREWLCLLALGLAACGRAGCSSETAQERAYMNGLQHVLQRLRAVDAQVAAAVPEDTVQAAAIVPLIDGRFLPTLRGLQAAADSLRPTARLAPVHAELVGYLALRVRAFELARDGATGGAPQLLDAFAAAQEQADRAGRSLEQAIARARAPRGP